MTQRRPTVALLGTGIMGVPMARNLLRAGFPVRAWNRSRSKAEPLAAEGAILAATPAEAAAGAGVVLTMLTDADAVAATMTGPDGAATAAPPGTLWLQMSTVGVGGERRLAAIAREHDLAYLDAPVLGTKKPAEGGALTVLASGPDELRERAQPVFDAVGASTRWLGPAGTGSRLKMVVNSWVLAVTTATAEAVALAEGLDLDPQTFLDTIAGGPLDTPYAHLKAGLMLRREFPASFPVAGAAKDAALVLEAAEAANRRLALAEAVRRQMSRAAELGHGDDDMAAVYVAATKG